MQPARDWRTIILVIANSGLALAAFLFSAGMVGLALVQTFTGRLTQDAPPLLDTIVLSSAIAFAGLVMLPAAYLGLQRWRGRPAIERFLQPFKLWQGILLVVVWVIISVLAQFFYGNNLLEWFTPILYVLSIALPVYFFVRLATGGLRAGSPQRTWGVFSTGLALGTSIGLFFELLFLLLGLFLLGIYISLHPDLLSTFRQISSQLSNSRDNLDQIMNLVGPWLLNPLALLFGLLIFSVITPLIEEPAKSLTVWLVFDRLDSPRAGFAMGALSGAGFGLLESLLASASPDGSWSSTLLIRGGSTMMHIMAASITGWGIASFRINKKFKHLVGGYLSALALHSTWNACVVLIVGGGLRLVVGNDLRDVPGILMALVGVAGLLALCLLIPIALGMVNWRFRSSLPAQASAPIQPMAPPIDGPADPTAGGNV